MKQNRIFVLFAAFAALALTLACAGTAAPVAPQVAPTALIETAAPSATEAPAATETLVPTPGPACPVLLDADVPSPYIPLEEGKLLGPSDYAIIVVSTYTDCDRVTASVGFGQGGWITHPSIIQNDDGHWIVTQVFVLPAGADGIHAFDRQIGKVACQIAKHILSAKARGVLTTDNSEILWRPGQDEKLPPDCNYYNP